MERDYRRDRSATNHASDSDLIAPGHSRRSTELVASTTPIISRLVQRKARDANGVAEDAAGAVATASSSSGHTLPVVLQRKFESSLGADLSSVRVHTGSSSHDAAHAVGAKAYTVGNDIHFGAGHYDPSSSAGEHLLAHEVAHTVQQAGGLRFKLEVSTPGDHLEVEADRAADAMVAGSHAQVTSATGLARKPEAETAPKKPQAAASANITALQTKLMGTSSRLSASNKKFMANRREARNSYAHARTAIKEESERYKEAYKDVKAELVEAHESIEQWDELKGMVFDAVFEVVTEGAMEGLRGAKEVVEHTGVLRKIVSTIVKNFGSELATSSVSQAIGLDTQGKDKVGLDGDTGNPADVELAAIERLDEAKDALDELDELSAEFVDFGIGLGEVTTQLEADKSDSSAHVDAAGTTKMIASITAACDTLDAATLAARSRAMFTEQLAKRQLGVATPEALAREVWVAWIQTLDADEFKSLRDCDGIADKLKVMGLYDDVGGNNAQRAAKAIGKTAQSYGSSGLGDGQFFVRVTGLDGKFTAVRDMAMAKLEDEPGPLANVPVDLSDHTTVPAGVFGSIIGVDSGGRLIMAARLVSDDTDTSKFDDTTTAEPPTVPMTMHDALAAEHQQTAASAAKAPTKPLSIDLGSAF